MVRKSIFATIFLLLIYSLHSIAQGHDAGPYISIGKIGPVFVSGSWDMPVTTTAALLSTPRFTSSTSDYSVISFVFSIKPARGNYIGPIYVNGSEFPEQVIKILQTSSGASGSVYFEDIKAVGPDHKPRALNSLIFRYKN